MFKRFVFLCLFWINLTAFAATDAELLHQYLAQIYTLQAQFTQKVFSPGGKMRQVLTGKIILKKPKQFVWQIDSPNPQKIISNGRELWLYQEKLKQAMRKPLMGTINKTPIEFLSGSTREISYYFHVRALQKGNKTIFYLNSKDKKIAFQKMDFTFLDGRLHQIVFTDTLGQKVEISLHHVRENINIPVNVFYFTPPKGVDVVQPNSGR